MTASSLELKAPAKLNLFLHVVGQRSDGMHLLESVFVLIDLCDDIVLELDPSGEITRTGDIVGDVEKDLCVRAARALQQASGTTLGCRILVKKRIPAGAGMGGGSSDCASTLMGLNKLWELNWPRKNSCRSANHSVPTSPSFSSDKTPLRKAPAAFSGRWPSPQPGRQSSCRLSPPLQR